MRIHADHQPYRKKPYVARWYEGTRQRNKFFASAAARDEFIHQLKETAQRQDPVLPTIAPHQLIRWQQAIAIAPEADPVEVFKFWKAEQRKDCQAGRPLPARCRRCLLQSMENVGRNKSYIGHVRRALADLEDEFGNRSSGSFPPRNFGTTFSGCPTGRSRSRTSGPIFKGRLGGGTNRDG
jgi:hypothetical protein